MRCTRIEFKGYKRLADAATNINGDITAFVGLNEAGKTTLLRALEWLTDGGALAVTDRNRSRPPASEDTEAVRAYFALDAGDEAAIADIPMDTMPTSLVLGRRVDGNRTCGLVPDPKRPPKPFTNALTRLEATRKRLAAQFSDAEDEDDEGPNDWARTVAKALTTADAEWTEEQRSALKELAAWLAEVPANSRATKPRDQRLSNLLAEVHACVDADHPAHIAQRRLLTRVPAFVMFTDEHRVLETVFELKSEETRKPPPALRDLLIIAEVDIGDLWTHIAGGDSSRRETLLDHGNERLLQFFSQAWNQSNITVRLNVTGTRLEVLVKELRDMGAVTNIAERSDGLRAFVAIAAFVASGGYKVPPILMIDEAETHLHYNAQADLVGVLLKSIDATQVFYTTHSPGCLPSDLGTGIRLLSRDPSYSDASIIRNDFWRGEEPGFTPLLYAMGAGAAAFSMCRKAVLAEGPSDMILLPSLVRLATGERDLEYQVAPGLANAHAFGMRVEEVAAKVVYLTDGDDGGAVHRKHLRDAGVPTTRIFQLPNGLATEDLVQRDDYVAVVNGLLKEMNTGRIVRLAELPSDKTIARGLTNWSNTNRIRLPSKVEIAYALLRHDGLRLTRKGRAHLKQLHERFTAALA